MKTYEKPTVEMIELREAANVMIATSSKEYQSGETILSNRHRNTWSSGWED